MHEPERLRALNMISALNLKILVDDVRGTGAARPEHGFSLWMEADNFRVLFDTGAGSTLGENARHLGVDLGEVDAVAISHGHNDHTGGLSCALSECRKASFFIHPGALRERYSRSADGSVRSAGFPLGAGELFADRKDRVKWTPAMTHVRPGVFVTGEIPRKMPPEASTTHFFLDPGCGTLDPLSDDQALVVDTAQGAVVVLGCSHAGVGNSLAAALSHSLSGKLRAVIGGMHLVDAPAEQIDQLADRLAQLGPQIICACHCTGQRAKDVLKRMFPAAYREGSTGAVLTFNTVS
jgi:7,8-dihydropterin-6-yl-methyl-4-(beta-D-ribofuranosyl)aminobenzene 5'-phosphate synthase